MNQQQKDTLNEYSQLKKDIKFLEEKAKILNGQVLEIMQVSRLEEIDVSDLGKLSLGSRRKWNYSNKLKETEAELKDMKKTEEQTGEADYQETHYVMFKAYEKNQ